MRPLLLTFSSILLLALFSPVFATESVTTKIETRINKNEIVVENKKQFLEEKNQKLDQMRAKVATREAAFKQKFATRVKEILSKHVKHQQAVLARLDSIAGKIQSRIDKLNAEGKDTTAASVALTEAKNLGDAATSAVGTAKTKVDAIDTSSSEVRTQAQAAQDAVKAARSALFDYHKGLVAVVVEIKKLRVAEVESEE